MVPGLMAIKRKRCRSVGVATKIGEKEKIVAKQAENSLKSPEKTTKIGEKAKIVETGEKYDRNIKKVRCMAL